MTKLEPQFKENEHGTLKIKKLQKFCGLGIPMLPCTRTWFSQKGSMVSKDLSYTSDRETIKGGIFLIYLFICFFNRYNRIVKLKTG